MISIIIFSAVGFVWGWLLAMLWGLRARRKQLDDYSTKITTMHKSLQKLQSQYIEQEIELVGLRNEAADRRAALLNLMIDLRKPGKS